jgi:prepilin-type N-terminal cleavage/methylation domain-containing protein
MQNKNGFTLIELLVVVLIIGVLTAVALPRYQAIVNKSKASEALIAIRALAEAHQLYFMANGRYTDDFRLVSFNLPGTLSNDGRTLSTGIYNYTLSYNNGAGYPEYYRPMAALNGSAKSKAIPALFCSGGDSQRNLSCSQVYCRGPQKSAATKVCLALGGVYHSSNTSSDYYTID